MEYSVIFDNWAARQSRTFATKSQLKNWLQNWLDTKVHECQVRGLSAEELLSMRGVTKISLDGVGGYTMVYPVREIPRPYRINGEVYNPKTE